MALAWWHIVLAIIGVIVAERVLSNREKGKSTGSSLGSYSSGGGSYKY